MEPTPALAVDLGFGAASDRTIELTSPGSVDVAVTIRNTTGSDVTLDPRTAFASSQNAIGQIHFLGKAPARAAFCADGTLLGTVAAATRVPKNGSATWLYRCTQFAGGSPAGALRPGTYSLQAVQASLRFALVSEPTTTIVVGRIAARPPGRRAQASKRVADSEVAVVKPVLTRATVSAEGMYKPLGNNTGRTADTVGVTLRLDASKARSAVTFPVFDLFARPARGSTVALRLSYASTARDGRVWFGQVAKGDAIDVWLGADSDPALIVGQKYSLLVRLVDGNGKAHWLETPRIEFTHQINVKAGRSR